MTGESKIPCLYKGLSALKNIKTHIYAPNFTASAAKPMLTCSDLCLKSLILQKSSEEILSLSKKSIY
jgi:hypothetical protein